MVRHRKYYTLIASLPALPVQFDVERCPITWPRLDDRLRMLASDDAATLQRLLNFLAWDRQPLDRMDDDVLAHYKSLLELVRHPLLRAIIDHHMDIRTITSALRRRRLGWGPPPGSGPYTDLIRRRWHQPQFGLQQRFPWIAELDQRMADGTARDAERLMLSVTWTMLSRASHKYTFTFEAVLLYVARWAIVNRWTSQNAPAGRERFENILAKVLEGHVHFSQ